MIRGGSRSGRIALLVCVSAALAAAPATAGAQSAQDEYQLDIPGGGSGSNPATPGGTPPAATAAGTGSGSTETGTGTGAGTGTGSGSDAAGSHPGDKNDARQRKADEDLALSQTHDGKANALDTNSRSAPEVVADTVLDSAMLPILAALVLITGVGAWRVLRSRRSLSGQAG
jgi:hypothetical protein